MDNTAMAFGAAKTAALYFDQVVPLPGIGLSELPMPASSSDWFRVSPRLFTEAIAAEEALYPHELFGPPENRTASYHDLHAAGVDLHLAVVRRHMEATGLATEHLVGGELTVSEAWQRLLKICSDLGLSGCPIVTPAAWESTNSDESPRDGVIALSNVRLVDVTKTPWDQILALREDPEARKRLRRLRAFARANYTGRSAAYVEDDLASRIEDYERTVREWRFETTLSVLSVMLSGRAISGAAATGLAAALFGAPTLGALGSAAAVEVGNVLVTMGRARLEHRQLRETHPVAYLVEGGIVSNTQP